MSAPSAAHHRHNGHDPSRNGPVQLDVEFLECAPQLVGALTGGQPRFADVAMASYLARSDEVPEVDREFLRSRFNDMFQRFEEGSGRIVSWYVASEVFAAAALTEKDGISVTLGRELPRGTDELVNLIRRCQQVAFSAWHRLDRLDRVHCQAMVFQVIEEALRRLDTDEVGRADDCMGPLRDRLDQAEDFMLRCARRRAQARYLKGMLFGTVAIGAVIAAVTIALVAMGELTRLGGQLLLVATAGTVGAVVSVLWRMTSGSFRMNLPTLDHDMKGTDLRIIAALRPVIGLVFALAAIVLVMGELIPLDQQDGESRSALFAGIGFLAGFSERLAQDMFARSGQGLAGAESDSPGAGPSAGLSTTPGAILGSGPGTS
jgi:hypothetical protein